MDRKPRTAWPSFGLRILPNPDRHLAAPLPANSETLCTLLPSTITPARPTEPPVLVAQSFPRHTSRKRRRTTSSPCPRVLLRMTSNEATTSMRNGRLSRQALPHTQVSALLAHLRLGMAACPRLIIPKNIANLRRLTKTPSHIRMPPATHRATRWLRLSRHPHTRRNPAAATQGT